MEDVLDSIGQYTGVQRVLFSEPTKARGNISASAGDASIVQFGTSIDYDSVIVMRDTDMDENAVLWIGVTSDKPYNYTVRRISRSLNSVAIAVKRVDVSA